MPEMGIRGWIVTLLTLTLTWRSVLGQGQVTRVVLGPLVEQQPSSVLVGNIATESNIANELPPEVFSTLK